MTERQVILSNLEALVGADLSKAFKAVRAEKVRKANAKLSAKYKLTQKDIPNTSRIITHRRSSYYSSHTK